MNHQNEKSLTDDILSLFNAQSQSFSAFDVRKSLACDLNQAQATIDQLLATNSIQTTLGGRYFSPPAVMILQGTVSATDRGFGFATTQDGARHFVPPPQMATLLAGDLIEFFVTVSPKNGKPAAEVTKVLNRPETYWLGTVSRGALGWMFACDEGLNPTFVIDAGGIKFIEGDTIQLKVGAGTPATRMVSAKAVCNIGRRGRAGFDIDYSIAKYRIPAAFSAEALAQAKAMSLPSALENDREDLRAVGFVTIDGEESRDFDDALFAQRTDSGFTLLVAIADVSHYVSEGSPLDVEARERATSVYYPGRTLPMLPEVLSNGLCSLNPGEDRYALVAHMDIAADGKMLGRKFYPAVIRSKNRLTYSGVTSVLEGGEKHAGADTVATLKTLEAVHKALRENRAKKGLLQFERREPELVVVNDKVVDIGWRVESLADRVVEDCMLAANHAAAAYLYELGGAQLYRHHAAPQGEEWSIARASLKRFGIDMPENATLESMANALEHSRNSPDFPVIEDCLRGTMSSATYSVQEPSHFSLAMAQYTHFTSPIRRYADLLVHRALKQGLRGALGQASDFAEVASHCSDRSRRADQATRMVWTLIKRRHLAGHKGKPFEVKALKNVARGLKVVILDWDCVGFIPAQSLSENGYVWDEALESWGRYKLIEPGMRLNAMLTLSDDTEILLSLLS